MRVLRNTSPKAAEKPKQGAFTLLEVIIVIIIIGVLASLALPRYFQMIESSRGVEAVNAIGVIRGAMERCYLMKGNTYYGCTMTTLDIANPSDSPGTHFLYAALTADLSSTQHAYLIVAVRNSYEAQSQYQSQIIAYGFGTVPIVGANGQLAGLNGVYDNKSYWAAAQIYQSAIPHSN